MKRLLALLVFSVLAGCATTESLYAEYEDSCPVGVRVTDTGMVTVSGIAAVEGGAPQLDSQVWEPAIYFGFDKHELAESERARLDRDIAILNRYPSLQVSIQAFTDGKGSMGYNRRLANRRMRQVKNYLMLGGIYPSRIKQSAMGQALPILPSMAPEDRVINRRVELMLLDAKGRPLVMRADIQRSGGDDFVPPEPVE